MARFRRGDWEQIWRKQIAEQQQSGLSIPVFCRERGCRMACFIVGVESWWQISGMRIHPRRRRPRIAIERHRRPLGLFRLNFLRRRLFLGLRSSGPMGSGGWFPRVLMPRSCERFFGSWRNSRAELLPANAGVLVPRPG